MPTVADLVKVRPEVMSGTLHGIISLYSLISDEQGTFENTADRVLSATFPSEALRRLLQRLRVSLSDNDADRKANFFLSGGYGSGKSHLLLTLYHILNSPKNAGMWLADHEIDFLPPTDAEVVLLPMNQMTKPDGSSIDYLWEPIFEALDYNGFTHTGGNFPTAKHIEAAANGRLVFLIVDEIERWFMPQLQNGAQAQANLTFLQNLTEFCQSATNGVFTIITLLRLDESIKSTIDRVDAFREDLTQAPDRRQIVLHRLIEGVDAAAAEAVVEAYINQYQPVDSHVGIGDYAAYRAEMLQCYPFHPVTIETVFEQYSSVANVHDKSYQNSRGALYLLGHALQEAVSPTTSSSSHLSSVDLIRVGDLSLMNRIIYDDLANLETQLVNVARRNAEASEGIENADALLSTILLYSLGSPQATRRIGAEMKDLLLGVLRPASSPAGGVSPNQLQASLVKLQDTAINLWPEENPPRWVLKADVNILTQVSRRANTEAVVKQAPNEIVQAIHDLVPGPVVVFPAEEVPDLREITIVVSTKYLDRDEALTQLYRGKANPNGLVIVIPRSHGSILADPDLLSIARTRIAAEQIRKEMMGAGDIPRLLVERATSQDLHRAIPSRYGKWLTPVLDGTTNELHFRGIDVKLDKASILGEVQRRYDAHHFEECVMDAVTRRGDTPPTVEDIRSDFFRQRSYPKPVGGAKASDVPIDEAIRRLVRSGDLEVIVGGDAHYICGKDPGFLQKPWTVAVPPEEHKPKFDVRSTVIGFLTPKKSTGARVRDIREKCHEAVKQFAGEGIEDDRIDDVLIELLTAHQLETQSEAPVPQQPLPDSLVIRVRERLIDVKPTVELGPGKPQAVKTKLIQEVSKTDRLSQVNLDVQRNAKGGRIVESVGATLGLEKSQVAEATQLEVLYYLRQPAITNRDQLVELIEGLPQSSDVQVSIRFTKESPRGEGD